MIDLQKRSILIDEKPAKPAPTIVEIRIKHEIFIGWLVGGFSGREGYLLIIYFIFLNALILIFGFTPTRR